MCEGVREMCEGVREMCEVQGRWRSGELEESGGIVWDLGSW